MWSFILFDLIVAWLATLPAVLFSPAGPAEHSGPQQSNAFQNSDPELCWVRIHYHQSHSRCSLKSACRPFRSLLLLLMPPPLYCLLFFFLFFFVRKESRGITTADHSLTYDNNRGILPFDTPILFPDCHPPHMVTALSGGEMMLEWMRVGLLW